MGEEARRVSDARRVDVAVVSMSPYALERTARRIAKNFGYPLVLDLRDPWAIDGWHVYRTLFDWYADLLAMKRALRSAAGIVANTEEAAKAISSRLLGSNGPPLTVIPNGYDSSDFARTTPIATQLNDSFVIVHTGYLHDRAIEPPAGLRDRIVSRLKFRPEPIILSGRTVVHLARALTIVQSRNPGFYEKLLIVLVGIADDATRRQIDRIGHAQKFRFVGYVSHATSISWLKRADALFLPLHGLPPGYRSLIVPGKTYEYVASGKPILGAVPPGDARDILDEYGRAAIADPVDPVEIAAGLERVAMLAKDSTDWSFPSSLRRFRRDLLAQRFSSFLEHVIREHRENGRRESRKGRELVR
jgi:glycosyltransferase involved in cell wall biosynthesis